MALTENAISEVPVILPIVLNDADNEVSETNSQLSDLPVNSNINVENSSEVVFGNVTQFHGPVTIYQSAANNTHIESNTEQQSPKLVATETLSVKPLLNITSSPITKKSFVLGIIIITLIFICITLALAFYIIGEFRQEAKSEIQGSSPQFITREQWGGRPPLYIRKIIQPTKYVIISHTASQFCTTIPVCSKQVAQFQNLHIQELLSPDVGYNFLIGGDGNIYVGRGWDAANFHRPDSIGISYIGNYIYDSLTPGMIIAAQKLLEQGLKENKLEQDYILVAHNQTWNTLSPGANVYNVIKFWPHFTPEVLEDDT